MTTADIIAALPGYQPAWVCLIVTMAILAQQSPKIIKELFAGICVLFRTIRANPKRDR
jgi:hypothetical protein